MRLTTIDIPSRIGRYRVLDLVGAGSMGIVYRAFDPVLERTVAIKTIRCDLFSPRLDYKRFISRFYREARISGTLSHPNIVSLFDMGETEQHMPFLAMEYVEGKTLGDLLWESERLTTGDKLLLLSQIARAIDYAHGKGVVHRDIKPSNIIVEDSGNVKITDFGIAKLMDSPFTQTGGSQLGTPGYMSPEQVKGEELDARSDIFSLGVVAFEMLSGEKPFAGPHVAAILYRLVHRPPHHPASLESLGLVVHEWQEVFSRALAKNPRKRHACAGDLARELEAVCPASSRGRFLTRTGSRPRPASPFLGAHSSVPATDDTITLGLRPRSRASRWRSGVRVILLAAAVGIASVSFFGNPLPHGSEMRFDSTRAGLAGPRSLRLSAVPSEPPEAATGIITVRSDPEGATVLLNGRDRGVSPIELTELPFGAHAIRVEKESYQTVDLAVLLSADGPQTVLDIPLRTADRGTETTQTADGRAQSFVPTEIAPSPSVSYVILSAVLRLQGKQLLLRNQDPFDWIGVRLELSDPGVILNIDRIRAGQTYTIVHPPTLAPQRVTIACDTPTAKGYYSAVLRP